MEKRAMVIVAGGSSSRFGSDKLTQVVEGRHLISHTIAGIVGHVDRCVVAIRADLVEWLRDLEPSVEVVAGGPTRTASELAGTCRLDDSFELIGIHDGARPLVSPEMVEALFELAGRVGGALPVLAVDDMIVATSDHPEVVEGLARAQTPQVFRDAALIAALRAADGEGFNGQDTVEVVQRYTDLRIKTVPGSPDNVKVTYPADLEVVRRLISDSSRT